MSKTTFTRGHAAISIIASLVFVILYIQLANVLGAEMMSLVNFDKATLVLTGMFGTLVAGGFALYAVKKTHELVLTLVSIVTLVLTFTCLYNPAVAFSAPLLIIITMTWAFMKK